MEAEGTRINKYLSTAGFCSRRHADELIAAGRVYIGDEEAVVGSMVYEGDAVRVDGQLVTLAKKEALVIAFNKPRGIVCTAAKDDKDNIVDHIDFPTRIYPVGRLDKDSQGLILLTDDGDLTYHLLKTSENHTKEYVVEVDKDITDEFIRHMSEGVEILGKVTRRCKVKRMSKRVFDIELMQGLNRQIRRMCEALGYKVITLKRIRIENIKLGDLKEGKYRILQGEELEELRRRVLKSGRGSDKGTTKDRGTRKNPR